MIPNKESFEILDFWILWMILDVMSRINTTTEDQQHPQSAGLLLKLHMPMEKI